MTQLPCVQAWVTTRQSTADGFGTGVTTPGVGEDARQWCGSARKENSARDGVTEGGKGRSEGPLPSQAQHAADHTRPKSM